MYLNKSSVSISLAGDRSHVRLLNSAGRLVSQLLLKHQIQVLLTRHPLEVALAHAILLLARQRLRHVRRSALLKAPRNSFDLELGSNLRAPVVVVLGAGFVV